MAYAIMRTEKLKTFGNIGGCGSHHFRSRETKNADQSKTPDNIRLIDCNDDLVGAVKKRIGDIKLRKNGVLAIEVLLTASPDFFRDDPAAHGEYKKQKVDDFNQYALDYLKAEYGTNNVVSAICHLDEATPHIQAVIVPIDYEKSEKGKLNAAKWLDGRKLLSEMQDRYFEAMKPLGLERGIKGSESKHSTIKEFYGSLESAEILTIPPVDIDKPPIIKREKWANDESERINDLQKPNIKPIQTKAATSAIATKRAKQAQATAKKYSEELDRMKAEAKLVRDTDLADVLEKSNAKKVAKNTYDYNGERIKITGSKFFNHYQNVGGGGAIDLVMHLQDFNFAEAVGWLGGEIGNSEAVGAAMHDAKEKAQKAVKAPAPIPDPVPQHWPHVRDYLVNKRGLKPEWIDHLHEKGRIYADFMQNACFKYGDMGVEKRGTRGIKWQGANGSKDAGFKLKTKNATGVVFVESAIDALSFADLRHSKHELAMYRDYDVIAVGGLSSNIVSELSRPYKDIVLGFDNDKNLQGDKAYERIKKYIVNKDKIVTRLKPERGYKDWNDYVKPVTSEGGEGEEEKQDTREDNTASMK